MNDQFGKLFVKCRESGNEIAVLPYNETDKYYEIIKTARSNGFKQVIVNSEIMINLLYTILGNRGIILKINMSDNTDDEIKDNIKSIIRSIKKDKLNFVKLKDELEWATESGSIDINSIEIFITNIKAQIYSNGILFSQNNETIFNIIKATLEEYFNE
ncbi:hypothetical protein [Sporolactobacillus terrae]|uniref:hypothetical protein n=1 Tax=Sporolactobacillus terrae TaxID=269673 RepID=UPI001CC0C5B4|nr:hypothetical protein [Sporolactobacillus terrae]UAK17540.1 hypothetical protein K7399_06335 [Sporolactobacillus terrae]